MDTFVGYSAHNVPFESGVNLPLLVFYPTFTPERPERLGAYTLDLALNAELKSGVFPLVVISHGGGGTPYVYRDLAKYLAKRGFVVAIPEHPFNNRRDNSKEGTIENLTNRPRHLRTVIDWMFKQEPYASALKPNTVGVVGHSMGGFTALAVAGAVPTCLPHEAPDRQPHAIKVEREPRVRALVLFAPASVWYRVKGAFDDVDLPILMYVGEKDFITPYGIHGRLVLEGVRDRSKIDYRMVKNGGHFAFLTPFPPEMTNPDFPPSQDPAGFDRVWFQRELHADVVDFLGRLL